MNGGLVDRICQGRFDTPTRRSGPLRPRFTARNGGRRMIPAVEDLNADAQKGRRGSLGGDGELAGSSRRKSDKRSIKSLRGIRECCGTRHRAIESFATRRKLGRISTLLLRPSPGAREEGDAIGPREVFLTKSRSNNRTSPGGRYAHRCDLGENRLYDYYR